MISFFSSTKKELDESMETSRMIVLPISDLVLFSFPGLIDPPATWNSRAPMSPTESASIGAHARARTSDWGRSAGSG